jgi:glucose-1-phosphate thymidylyltransferase
MTKRKGIILAGGTGTRLFPLTIGVSKQLLPVYDKPMIYYPLTVLMLAGINDILIITTPQDRDQFKRVLGDGSQWGVKLSYTVQPSPDGLAQAFILAEDFLNGAPSSLILGDNIFFGHGLPEVLASASARLSGATVFGYHVKDPEQYGVVGFDDSGKVNSIVEKPTNPSSNLAITGLYFMDSTAPTRAKKVRPSSRGELEITSLLESYLDDDDLAVEKMGRGYAWLDTGTHGSLLDAGNFVRTLTERQGLQVGSPEEVAFRQKFIDRRHLHKITDTMKKSPYKTYLEGLLKDCASN